jgi:regulator of sigma E protease
MAEEGIAESAGLEIGDKILSINDNPVDNWNDVLNQYVSNLGNDIVFQIQRDDEIKNITLGREILKEKSAEQLDILPTLPAQVGKIMPESPAEKAGLQTGDKIISIEGQPISSWDEMTGIIQQNAEVPLSVTISRNDEQLTKTITPVKVDIIGENGESNIVGQIGIGQYVERRELAVIPALTEGFSKTIFITGLNIKAIGWLITGKKSAREMLGGPIMITQLAAEFAEISFDSLMDLIANLSIMLALINILPVPALDGGHITIVLIEQIRRKPLSTKTKIKIQQVGMAILLVLIVFVMYNDILRIFN